MWTLILQILEGRKARKSNPNPNWVPLEAKPVLLTVSEAETEATAVVSAVQRSAKPNKIYYKGARGTRDNIHGKFRQS